ncbi:MAG: urease accessory protein UreF [Ahrensia sp.]|nr:urease accessory protein UreF [Ahrensia sp.]
MTDTLGLARLMTWLSPVFPTGGFAYSSGLEAAAASGSVTDATELNEWLAGSLQHGALRNDAIIFAEAWRRHDDGQALADLADLALALASSHGRHLEMTAQGNAFVAALANWPDMRALALPDPCSLSVAVGAAAGFSKIDPEAALTAMLQSTINAQLQAAIRLSLIGQNEAAVSMSALEALIVGAAEAAARSTLDDLGNAAFMADIMAMKHEGLSGRMFRT